MDVRKETNQRGRQARVESSVVYISSNSSDHSFFLKPHRSGLQSTAFKRHHFFGIDSKVALLTLCLFSGLTQSFL